MNFDATATEQFFLTGSWETQTYRGVPIYKFPTDLMVYHQLIHQHNPEIIVELGTAKGGSALWFRDQPAGAKVITVDLARHWMHEQVGIHYVTGNTVSDTTVEYITNIVGESPTVLISLDSNHTYSHVREELNLYAPLVPVGSHLIVEDTFLGYMKTPEAQGPFSAGNNPLVAVNAFLDTNNDFARVPECDQYSVSMNPGGWLRRVA